MAEGDMDYPPQERKKEWTSEKLFTYKWRQYIPNIYFVDV